MKSLGLLWIILTIVSVLGGYAIGWNARVADTRDRYLTSLAERHEAYTRYMNTQADNIITNNTLEAKRRQQR